MPSPDTDTERKDITFPLAITVIMSEAVRRKLLASFALLSLPVGAYLLVLFGAVPVGYNSGVVLTAVAGAATLGAVGFREKDPAIAAGVTTVGYGLSIVTSGFLVTSCSLAHGSGWRQLPCQQVYCVGSHAYAASAASRIN